jgi:hypothetical protein
MFSNFYCNGHNIEITLQQSDKCMFSHLDTIILSYSSNGSQLDPDITSEELEDIDNMEFYIDLDDTDEYLQWVKDNWNHLELPSFNPGRDEDDISQWYSQFIVSTYEDDEFRIACLLYQIYLSFGSTVITGDYDC